MAQNDPIIQMVGDPDFPKMSLPEQQKALTAHDPMFGNMDPMNITAFVQAHQAARTPSGVNPILAAQGLNVNPQAQSQAPIQALQKNMQYTPDRKFEMNVAKGMGLDPNQLASAESRGTGAAYANLGKQVMTGAGKFATSVAKDPFNITQPVESMASNVERGIKERSPGQVLGAATSILGASEGGDIAGAAIDKIPSAARSGAEINAVSSAIGKHTVDISDVGTVALRALELNDRAGFTLPAVMRRFLVRAADPAKGPITFEEARDMYSGATKLSVDESKSIKGQMKALVPEFAAKLGNALNETADRAGRAEQYSQALREYNQAKSMKSAGKTVAKFAVGGGLAATGEELARRGMLRMLGK